MILTDYLRAEPDLSWDIARQCGVRHAVIRLPETPDFDVTDLSHLRTVCKKYTDSGFSPCIIEPLPNELHDHIKLGDGMRDECIEKFIRLMANMHETGIGTVCFNFMAHYGWTRTSSVLPERGGARVTGFRLADFRDDGFALTREQVFDNYGYFVRAAVPYAERYGIRLALHPDDPPLPYLGRVGRVFTDLAGILKGMSVVDSPNLGVTYCQACYRLMGEDAAASVDALHDKIFFIHFRNVRGEKTDFSETFHDNGELPMAEMLRLYKKYSLDVPIRVDHVPTLAGETQGVAGYDALGRLYAIGYLKGLLEALDME